MSNRKLDDIARERAAAPEDGGPGPLAFEPEVVLDPDDAVPVELLVFVVAPVLDIPPPCAADEELDDVVLVPPPEAHVLVDEDALVDVEEEDPPCWKFDEDPNFFPEEPGPLILDARDRGSRGGGLEAGIVVPPGVTLAEFWR